MLFHPLDFAARALGKRFGARNLELFARQPEALRAGFFRKVLAAARRTALRASATACGASSASSVFSSRAARSARRLSSTPGGGGGVAQPPSSTTMAIAEVEIRRSMQRFTRDLPAPQVPCRVGFELDGIAEILAQFAFQRVQRLALAFKLAPGPRALGPNDRQARL